MAIWNRTRYNRSPNDGVGNSYTKLNSDLIEDSRINIIQVGIMTYILNQSDDWAINKKMVLKHCKIPVGKFNDAWDGLMDLGYIEKERVRGGVEWIINETPQHT